MVNIAKKLLSKLKTTEQEQIKELLKTYPDDKINGWFDSSNKLELKCFLDERGLESMKIFRDKPISVATHQMTQTKELGMFYQLYAQSLLIICLLK